MFKLFRIENLVSLQWIGANQTCEFYNSITNFAAIPKFIPQGLILNNNNACILLSQFWSGLDQLSHAGYFGYGQNWNQFPTDANVTFFFEYDKATIENIEIYNLTDNENQDLGKGLLFDVYMFFCYKLF